MKDNCSRSSLSKFLSFQQLEALNNGKHYNEALFDIDFSIKCIEYFAGWSDKIFGKTIPVDGSFFTYTRHEAIGVCAGKKLRSIQGWGSGLDAVCF